MKKTKKKQRFSIALMLSFLATFGNADIRIAVATNFKPTLETLVAQYQKSIQELIQDRIQEGVQDSIDPAFIEPIQLSSASTGTLYAQIQHGAPFDLFFSADANSVNRLKQKAKFSKSLSVSYAIGALVFWCPKGAPQDWSELSNWQGSFAQANDRLAPYGLAATQVIKALDWPETNRKILAANIAQVAHFVATGNLSCGFTARSLLPLETPESEYLVIPERFHQPIQQKALLIHSKAQFFLEFVQTQGQQILRDAGYLIPATTMQYSQLNVTNTVLEIE